MLDRVERAAVAERRSAGVSWDDIATEMTGDVSADEVFGQLTVPAWVSWPCSACGNHIVDFGPGESHPDDRELWHAASCRRHQVAIQQHEQADRL